MKQIYHEVPIQQFSIFDKELILPHKAEPRVPRLPPKISPKNSKTRESAESKDSIDLQKKSSPFSQTRGSHFSVINEEKKSLKAYNIQFHQLQMKYSELLKQQKSV